MDKRKRLALIAAREAEEEARDAVGRDTVGVSVGQSLGLAIARARDIARQRKKAANDEIPTDQNGSSVA